MEEINVATLQQYLGAVSKLLRQWKYLWYRGVENSAYKPLPGLLWRRLVKKEQYLVHEFLVSYKGILGPCLYEPWELYSLMQHHRLPTRLLDWTKSPLIALYFALEKEVPGETERAVWVMNPLTLNSICTNGDDSIYCPSELRSKIIEMPGGSKLNLDSYLPAALDAYDSPSYPQCPLAIEPPLSNSRIRAQQGCFTIHGSDKDSIDAIFSKADRKKQHCGLIKIKGEKSRKAILKALYDLGFTEETIYQDLDSLSNRIVREYGTPTIPIRSAKQVTDKTVGRGNK